MLRVVGCLTGQHDLRLVGVAVLICGLASVTSLNLLERGLAGERRQDGRQQRGGTRTSRAVWSMGAALTLGGGVWATHFVAMLAYRPGLPFGFALLLTALSLLIALLGSFVAVLIVVRAPRSFAARAGAGVVVAASVGAMHVTGMTALRIAAAIETDAAAALVAVGLGAAVAIAAMLADAHGRRWLAAALLVLSVCTLHFTAMSAVTLTAEGPAPPPDETLDPAQLAFGIAMVAIIILAWGLFAALMDAARARTLEAETRRLRRLLDGTFEGILFHHDGIVTEVNAQVCALLGAGREALVGREVRTVLGAATLPLAIADGAAASVETEIRDAAGRTHPVELLARPLADTVGGEQVLAVRDLSERRRAEQRIAHLAHHDPLTGLANRGLFGDVVREALSQSGRTKGRAALLCIDLDGFKAANDLLGHATGDQLLTAAAVRLRGTSRQMDAVARIGGDEFAILQSLAGPPEVAAILAERVVRLLGQPFEIGGQTIRIGASVGVALSPDDAGTVDDLLRKADMALRRAKQDGRGTYRFFEPGMDAHMKERRELELDLRGALAGNQFLLNFQGQYDTVTLAPAGYEALLRWDHPRLGRVSPAVFIPIAEASGTIREIGAWVLETACREAAGWTRPLRLSVNLSPAQFKGTDLPARIRATLARTGLPPARLELEITEGVLIDDPDRAFAVLSDIKAQGVRLALDDFGTGYASLGYLRRFPFDTLKIDKSFVQAIGQDAGSDAIVRAVIALGRSLGLEVIAEGVETPQQLAFLRAQKCHEVQGFLLAQPVTAADLDHAMTEAARA